VKAIILLADAAAGEPATGKVNMLGAGWSITSTPLPAHAVVALVGCLGTKPTSGTCSGYLCWTLTGNPCSPPAVLGRLLHPWRLKASLRSAGPLTYLLVPRLMLPS